MTSQDFVKLALQLTTMLGFAVLFGEVMRRFRQPAVVGDAAPHSSLAVNAALVGLLFVVVLGLGRRFGPAALRWIQPHVSWPSGFIAVMALLVLLASSASEALGVHAFLGAFLIGAALGDTRDHQKEAHDVIGNFVSSFAPIFFISMGMSTNFIANFDVVLVTIVLVVACISKVGAVLLGAKAAGMSIDREVWAIGFGLNARGATGIILAGVGLANGVIDARIFVAMVFMAAVTSLMAAPMMSRLLYDAVRGPRSDLCRSGNSPSIRAGAQSQTVASGPRF